MSKTIGSPATVTATKRRETFRIEVNVSGTDAAPVYELKGHACYIQRDANGVEIGRDPGYVTVLIPDASLPAGLKTGITNLIARLDTIALPGEP